jgi:hypothetical protein
VTGHAELRGGFGHIPPFAVLVSGTVGTGCRAPPQRADTVRGQTGLPLGAREAGLQRFDDPGAPSETTSSGSPRPRARMSWKNAVTVSASSLEPAIRCSRTLTPPQVCPQAASTGSRRCPGRSRSAIPSTNR